MLLSWITWSNLTCWLARRLRETISWGCKLSHPLIIVKSQSNQRRGMADTTTRPFLYIVKLISLGVSDEGQKKRKSSGGTNGGRGRTECGWARKLFFFLSRHFYSKTSLRCSTYYGAQNCLMCLFLLLMQQAAGRQSIALQGEVYSTIRPVSTI